jgi:SAM-dependent methyltransferase
MRVLDIGCGDGALTAKIAAAGADVLAIDHSQSQIDAALKLGLKATRLSALELDFENEFDAVFSNAALHWIRPPATVVANVARALKPGGRFVGEFGGAGNVEKIKTALIGALNARGLDGQAADPWYFPTPAEYRALLEESGFRVDSAELIPRPTPLPGSLADWIKTLAQDFAAPVPRAERDAFLAGIEDELAPELRDDQGVWTADYVRLRFAATLDVAV